MSDMKLIMEGWRDFSNESEEQLMIESIDRFEKQMLKELSRAERLDEGKVADFVKGKLTKTFKYVKGLASKAGELNTAVQVRVYKMLEKLATVLQSFKKRYPKIAKYGPLALGALGLLFFATGASAGEPASWVDNVGPLLDFWGSIDTSAMEPENAEYIERFIELAGKAAGEDGVVGSDWDARSGVGSLEDYRDLRQMTVDLQSIADGLAEKAMEAAEAAETTDKPTQPGFRDLDRIRARLATGGESK